LFGNRGKFKNLETEFFLRTQVLERFKNIRIFERMFENFRVVKISQVSKVQRVASSMLVQNEGIGKSCKEFASS
jgi:hypothetical protein